MSIVFLSIIGIALEEIQGQVFPINPTIIRVMRVLRIARVLKLLKMAKGIRALLDTVMQALPQVSLGFYEKHFATFLYLLGWEPWPSILLIVLHFCRPWCRAFWKTWYVSILIELYYKTFIVFLFDLDSRYLSTLIDDNIFTECDEEYPCQGLGEHAHFRSFGMAFLTLFRIATGKV